MLVPVMSPLCRQVLPLMVVPRSFLLHQPNGLDAGGNSDVNRPRMNKTRNTGANIKSYCIFKIVFAMQRNA